MPLGDDSFKGEQPDKNTPSDNSAAEAAQAHASGEGVNPAGAYRDADAGKGSLADDLTAGQPGRADTPQETGAADTPSGAGG